MIANVSEKIINESERQHRAFKTVFTLCKILIAPFYKLVVDGQEHIPHGAAIICGNHSAMIDPVFVFLAFGRDCHVHMMAKMELFKIPILSDILRAIGAIAVNRSKRDTSTIRRSLKLLNNDEVIGIFPEGTRRKFAYEVDAKTGAVRLSIKTGAPIIPVYVPREKKFLGTIHTVIGEPYYFDPSISYTQEDYERLAHELMEKIEALHPAAGELLCS